MDEASTWRMFAMEGDGTTYDMTPYGVSPSLMHQILRGTTDDLELTLKDSSRSFHIVCVAPDELHRDAIEIWWLRWFTRFREPGDNVDKFAAMAKNVPPPVWDPRVMGLILDTVPFCSLSRWTEQGKDPEMCPPLDGVIRALKLVYWSVDIYDSLM